MNRRETIRRTGSASGTGRPVLGRGPSSPNTRTRCFEAFPDLQMVNLLLGTLENGHCLW